ncbi:RraA family protein, partial [Photobacterium sp. R1]
GAVRDVVALSEMALGVKAIAICPFKTEKRQTGDRNVTLTVAHTLVYPGDILYADPNGILLSKEPLDLSVL